MISTIPTACPTPRRIYRYLPSTTPGLRARWWLPAAGPHLDPLEWDGPLDPGNCFPLPTAAAPDVETVNAATNVNDSNSGAGAARYGIIDGFIFLPAGVTHLRDNNGNTGELGMVLIGDCCGGPLVEQPGGNHSTNTNGPDRVLLDPVGITPGWHYVYNPQSDLSAFAGLDLEYSVSGAAGPWLNVGVMQPDLPTIEAEDLDACDPLPEGWSYDQPAECCQPKWISSGGDAEPVEPVLPATALPIADNEADAALRTGLVGTSALYAREDHNHPIRRQANPGDPVITPGGNFTILQSVILDRWSTEETYEYAFRVRVSQPLGTGWGWLNVPNIAGFQRPQLLAIGSYRNPSTVVQSDEPTGNGLTGASPRGPFMGGEVHHWSSTQRIYGGYFRRDLAITSLYVEFIAKYIRL